MKAKELRSMSEKDLRKKMDEIRKELIKENMHIASGTTPKNPGNVRKSKKTIARILTILNSMEANKKDE